MFVRRNRKTHFLCRPCFAGKAPGVCCGWCWTSGETKGEAYLVQDPVRCHSTSWVSSMGRAVSCLPVCELPLTVSDEQVGMRFLCSALLCPQAGKQALQRCSLSARLLPTGKSLSTSISVLLGSGARGAPGWLLSGSPLLTLPQPSVLLTQRCRTALM